MRKNLVAGKWKSIRKRDEAMIAAHHAGKTYAEIGREFGVSKTLVSLRIRHVMLRQPPKQSDSPFDRLRPHTVRALKQAGLDTVEQVLASYFAEELLKLHGFGRKALHDVEKVFLPLHYSRFKRNAMTPDSTR